MALIGVAFGLGFIFGPAIGGMSLGGFTVNLPGILHWKFEGFGIAGPGWVASAFCLANFVGAYFLLPESLRPNSEHARTRPRMAQWLHTLGHPQIGLLIGVFFLSTFAFTCFEVTLGLLVSRNFGLNFKEPHGAGVITKLFVYCGVIGVLVQGGMVGRLVKAMGEARLIALSLVLTALSLGPLAFIHGWGLMLATLALLSLGSGLTRAPVFGLISILTPATEQGATLGVAQSAGSLARIVGPIFAATLFDAHPAWPYVTAAGLSMLSAVLVWFMIVPVKIAPHPQAGNVPA
jgi:MFS family permease